MAARRDAQLAVAVSSYREYPSHGVGPHRRSCIGGRLAPAGGWSVTATRVGRHAKRRTLADCGPYGDGADGDPSVYVLRHEILFPEILLGEDGFPVCGRRLHVHST